MILGALAKKVNFGLSIEQWLQSEKQRGGRGFGGRARRPAPPGKGGQGELGGIMGFHVQLGNQFEKGGVEARPTKRVLLDSRQRRRRSRRDSPPK